MTNSFHPYKTNSTPEYPQWSYLQKKTDADDLDEVLGFYGNQGWELVTVIRIPSDPVYYRLFFKRLA